MVGEKYLQERVCMDQAITTWIQSSKRNKKSFFYEVDEFFVHLEYMHNGITF